MARTRTNRQKVKADQPLDEDKDRKIRDWRRRQERFTQEILELMKDKRYRSAVRDLLNIKRALDARETALDNIERIMSEREHNLETQKKNLGKQAAKLTKLRNELEVKIGNLEKRLEVIENDS